MELFGVIVSSSEKSAHIPIKDAGASAIRTKYCFFRFLQTKMYVLFDEVW